MFVYTVGTSALHKLDSCRRRHWSHNLKPHRRNRLKFQPTYMSLITIRLTNSRRGTECRRCQQAGNSRRANWTGVAGEWALRGGDVTRSRIVAQTLEKFIGFKWNIKTKEYCKSLDLLKAHIISFNSSLQLSLCVPKNPINRW